MNSILILSDLSKNSSTALQYAIHLNNLLQEKLVVFHCYQPSPAVVTAAKSEEETDILIKKDAAIVLHNLQAQVKNAYTECGITEVPLTTTVAVGINQLVVEKTIETARQQLASLIIMGTHGASGPRHRFFGSTTSTMISKSDIPVLAIPENFIFQEIKTIALASDLEHPDDELKRVLPLAIAMNACLDIVYLDYGIDLYARKEQNALKLMEKNDYKKIQLVKQKATIEQPLLTQLRKYLDDQKPQWLVMFTKERSFWDKILLRSKTEEMVSFLHLPLLSMKKRPT